MKKRTILSMSLLLTALMASADNTYGYLTFQKSDGVEQSVSVEGLKMTFSSGQVVVSSGSSTATFNLSDLSKMYFSDTATGIETVSADASGDATVQAWTLSGVSLGSFSSLSEARQKLSKGVYIVKQGEKTFKITRP
jgi:hypothetical protein